MKTYRWLLILEDQPALTGPEQRYRLWLVELDEEQPADPLRCETIEELYEALFARQQHQRQGDDRLEPTSKLASNGCEHKLP